jgi:hypothetical protein
MKREIPPFRIVVEELWDQVLKDRACPALRLLTRTRTQGGSS